MKIYPLLLGLGLTLTLSLAYDANPKMQTYIGDLKSEAKKLDPNFTDFDAKKGEEIFLSEHIGKRGDPISCASCHGKNITEEARNVHTNKRIKPLAPSVNSERLTDPKEVEKWLKRNFKDVYNREGSPLEKGDVLYYIQTK